MASAVIEEVSSHYSDKIKPHDTFSGKKVNSIPHALACKWLETTLETSLWAT